MGILVDENTRVMVQGITGREGSFHARNCIAYGANVVAGVTPGRGGSLFEEEGSGIRFRRGGRVGDRRQHGTDLRASALRRRCDR